MSALRISLAQRNGERRQLQRHLSGVTTTGVFGGSVSRENEKAPEKLPNSK